MVVCGLQIMFKNVITNNPLSYPANTVRQNLLGRCNYKMVSVIIAERIRMMMYCVPLSVPSVLISYSHTHDAALSRSPLSIVTALVDKIGKRLFLAQSLNILAALLPMIPLCSFSFY